MNGDDGDDDDGVHGIFVMDEEEGDINDDDNDGMIIEVANEIGNVNIVDIDHPHQQEIAAADVGGDNAVLGQLENRIPAMLIDHPAVVAFQSSDASFLVTDPRMPGNPIIYASDAFLRLTGYPVERVLGRNCRFLQGPETDPLAVAKMREAIDNGEDIIVRVLNYRWDGTTFWNDVLISAIRDVDQHDGEGGAGVLHFLGLQQAVVENIHSDEMR